MTIEETFTLINNLDVRETLRRFAPQWSIVFVDASGEIIDVIRFKEWPKPPGTLPPQMKEHPGTVKFMAQPGLYKTLDEVRKAVNDCVWAHKNA
jgi:hypothetical protein